MSDELCTVHLLGLPVEVHAEASAHMNALQRELELIRRRGGDPASVPYRLRALIDQLTAEFGGFGDQPVEEIDDAAERGEEAVDLAYRVPAGAADGARRLDAMLDEVDRYCRAREFLLTVATPDEAREYRRWFLAEFVRQIAGEAPTPWSRRSELQATATTAIPAEAALAQRAGALDLPEHWTVTLNGDARITVAGPLDLESAPALRELLLGGVLSGSTVVVDLLRCTFIDSIGLSVILAGLHRAEVEGVTMRFRLSDAVERLLRISGVLGRVDIEATT